MQCPVTFTKRAIRETGRAVDRHPRLTMVGLFGSALGLVSGLGAAIYLIAT
ncbi:MAG: hypothetical protein IT378_12210 [Sandaracinaceae bacterium]|nr:hypothetical protein [Sandaracinaceae bacterium]